MSVEHPDVKWSRMTSLACPEQHEGQLKSGAFFYFRYRIGRVQLGLGSTDEEAVLATIPMLEGSSGRFVSMELGHPLDGIFASDAERDETFATLLSRWRERFLEEAVRDG